MSDFYTTQLLNKYKLPDTWYRGASLLKRSIWFLLGRTLLCSLLPGTCWRKVLLRTFGAKIGKGGRIKPFVLITYPWNLTIGDYCWIGERVWIDNLDKVVLGDNVCLSQGVFLCTGNHNYKSPNFDLLLGSINIMSEVWIAANASIGPRTIIGPRSIVTLGSVFSGKVGADEILKGNPAISIRKRI